MPDQISLPGVPAEPALFQPEAVHGRAGQLRGYNLFFALVPLRDDAEHLAQVGAELRRRHGLRGPCLPPQNLHVSLHAVAATPTGSLDRISKPPGPRLPECPGRVRPSCSIVHPASTPQATTPSSCAAMHRAMTP
ncbi:hypothetical protein X551_00141 [Methylibium sp. T29]|nr:hypothetical protein X551_00141 [Methylibium sp. T29]EWS62205.1 hypothetical protein Y694_00048 [Methylibium sp. T29-B]